MLFDIKPYVDISDVTLDQSNIIYSESIRYTKYHAVAQFSNIEHGFYIPGLIFNSDNFTGNNELEDNITFIANQSLVQNYEHYYRNCVDAGLINPVAMHKPYNGILPTNSNNDNPILVIYTNGVTFGLYNTTGSSYSPVYCTKDVYDSIIDFIQNSSSNIYPTVGMDFSGCLSELADTAQIAFVPTNLTTSFEYRMVLYKLDHTKFKIVK